MSAVVVEMTVLKLSESTPCGALAVPVMHVVRELKSWHRCARPLPLLSHRAIDPSKCVTEILNPREVSMGFS